MATIETLMLANYAEALNGMLYVMGGGWTQHTRSIGPEQEYPPTSNISIAITVLTPWGDTNRRHVVRVWVESADGGDALMEVNGEMEVGRPPGTTQGSDLRSVIAVNGVVAYPSEGDYRVLATVREDGEAEKWVSFTVHDKKVGPLSP